MDIAEQLAEALRQAQEHLASIGYPADANGKYDKDGEWDFLESVPSRTDAREVLQAFNTIGAALDAYESTKGRDEPVAEIQTTLYIDMDGVMADFDGAFPAVFGLDHRSLADDDMWMHINGHPSFFRDLPPMEGAVEFFRSVEHLHPVILTACPKSNYAHVAVQKRAWVREHLSQTCLVLPVLGGRHKPLFMHQPGDILIDDFGKNCQAWNDAGGISIKHEGDWQATSSVLKSVYPYTHPAPQGPSAECWRRAMKKYAELPWGLRIGLGINGIAWIEQRAKELAEKQE